MEFFQIIDTKVNIQLSNLSEHCKRCFANCPVGISTVTNQECGNKRKRYFDKSDLSSFYFCSDEPECVGSNKIFKSKIKVIKGIVCTINEYKSQLMQELGKQNKRILHNIISLNGHNIQELYALVSDKQLSQKVEQQRAVIKENIETKIDDAVSMFLRIAKNNLAIQTNFNVFNKLLEPNPVLAFRKHKIRKVLLTVYHVFFEDFFDNHIQVIIEDSDAEVIIDFESISVAFYHILDNATKYALRDSKINIRFKEYENKCSVIFEMDSIEIKEEEKNKLTDEGYKGENSLKILSKGNGIGMFIIDQLLTLTYSKLIINPSISSRKQFKDGICYCRNQFIIELPNRLN